MIKTSTFNLKIVLLTPMLGSQPSRDIAEEYIAQKHGIDIPQDEELLLPDLVERGTSVFHRSSNGDPLLMNYQVLGFLKESGRVLNGKINGIKNLRYKVGMYVTITPRTIPLFIPSGESLDYFERPLRIETPKGPRVVIARSEMVPTGTFFNIGLEIIESEITKDVLEDLLNYGYSHGLGQWRGSGAFGTFRYELKEE